MSGRWNPNDPFTLGLEWDAREVVPEPIDYGREIGMVVTPTATVTVTGAAFYSPGPLPGGSDTAFTAWNLVTVYESGTERAHGPVRSATSAPNIASTTGGTISGAATALEAIESSTDDYYVELGSGDYLNINFAVPDIATDTPRIVDVTFSAIISPVVTGSSVRFRYGGGRPAIAQLDVDGSYVTYRVSTGEVFLNAFNTIADPYDDRLRPWFQGDLTDLASGAVDLRIERVTGTVQVAWVGLTVTYCEENRVASGGILNSSTGTWVVGWQTDIPLYDVTTETLGVQLLAGREYLVTVARASDVNAATIIRSATGMGLFSQAGPPRQLAALAPTDRTIVPGVAARRLSTGLLASDVASIDRGPAIVLESSAGVVESLSNPYAGILARSITPVTQDVISSHFTVATSHVAITTRRIGSPADLAITCGASTATVTAADYAAADHDIYGYARIVAEWSDPSTNLVVGVEKTVSAATGTGANRWEIPTLTTYGGTVRSAAGYGGLDRVGQGNTEQDYPITMITAAPAVTGAEIGRGFQALTPLDETCPTPLFHSIDYASVCWGPIRTISGSPAVTGSPVVTGFCAWEVERRDEIDTEWQRIARITDYNILCVSDYEARIGVVTDYRVRMCRTDGVCGDYDEALGFVRYGGSTATAAPAVSGTGCDGLIFTSNESPTSTAAYPYFFQGTPIEEFTFPEAAGVVYQSLHMRDYQVAFHPLERSGVTFTRTMLTNALSMPEERLDANFRTLRDLAWESLSYVCVLDMRGNRWFASVTVPTGSVREANHVYMASVAITEVTDRPTVIDVEAI